MHFNNLICSRHLNIFLSQSESGWLVSVMALEECVSDLICFRHFFDEWRQELSSVSVGNEVLTVTSGDHDGSNSDLPFETFAAQAMGCDIVPELDADCRLVM